ncbi:two component sensor kinase [Rhodobacteraceae bacterium KLH11]|nr:two component sensor kinase [Rhodobacteraceae bacterium KLH11]
MQSDLAYYLRISNHLAGELDIRSALRAVKDEIDRIITVDHLDICLIDRDKFCCTTYEVGLRTSWSATRSVVATSPIRDILTGSSDAMMTGDALSDDRYVFPGSNSEPIQRHHLRSRINVAMKVLGQTIGALNCSVRRPDYYSSANLEQVRTLADILAPYFFALRQGEAARKEAIKRARIEAQEEGLREGAMRLTTMLERERQRIGMDLHDQTLADMTRLARELKPGLSQKRTEKLQSEFQACIQDLRQIIDTSIPSILELFGFEEAVTAHFEQAGSDGSGLRLTVSDATGGTVDRLPEAIRTTLFRICQEALNNTIRHSGARQVRIDLLFDGPEMLELTISDDGRFRPPAERRSGGLAHMRTRARLIGARFGISKHNGTMITIQLPLPEMIESNL